MAEQIKFGDRLYLKGQELILDNGSNNAVIKSIDGTLKVDDNLVVTGDLTVNGTATTVNSTTLTVDDKNIELGSVTTPTDATANGGGITLKGATDKTILFVDSTDTWDFSEKVKSVNGFEGNLTGNVTGNITGNVTGDITSTGISAFAQIDVNGGHIDNTPIGVTTPLSGTFSTITGDGTAITNVLTNYTTDALTEGSSNLYFTDARIDTHLNQSNPNSGYVLSWNGTDYVWAPPSINFDKQFSSLLNTPTTLVGYGITDAATAAQGTLADSALQNETISLATLKTEVAASTDFADFKSRIAAL